MTERAERPVTYSGKLADLLPILTKEAETVRGAWPLERQWARRVLKGEAEVAVKVDETGRRLLRISRLKTPDGEKAWKAWRAELGTFHHHLQTKDWTPYEETQENGISATFHEPLAEPGNPAEEPRVNTQGIVTQLGSEGPTDSSRQPPAAEIPGPETARVGRAANPPRGS